MKFSFFSGFVSVLYSSVRLNIFNIFNVVIVIVTWRAVLPRTFRNLQFNAAFAYYHIALLCDYRCEKSLVATKNQKLWMQSCYYYFQWNWKHYKIFNLPEINLQCLNINEIMLIATTNKSKSTVGIWIPD